MKQNPKKARDVGFYALILVILLATLWTMTSQPKVSAVLLDSDIDNLFKNEQVKELTSVGNELTLELYEPFNDSKTVTKELSSIELFRVKYEDLIKKQKDAGIIKDYSFNPPAATPLWLSYVLP